MTPSAGTLLATVSVLLVVALPGTAAASERTVADPDDAPGRLDVIAVTHGHVDDLLEHSVRTQRQWASSVLADGTLTLVFRIGPRFRTLDVDYRNGRLVGVICTDRTADGGGGLVRCSRDVTVTRPDRRTVSVTLAPGLLRRDLHRYRWQVVTQLDSGEGGCQEVVCFDQVPDDGRWVRHRL